MTYTVAHLGFRAPDRRSNYRYSRVWVSRRHDEFQHIWEEENSRRYVTAILLRPGARNCTFWVPGFMNPNLSSMRIVCEFMISLVVWCDRASAGEQACA